MMKTSRNDDGSYGPVIRTSGAKLYYKPQPYHNQTAKSRNDKEKWCIKEDEQYKVFYTAAEDKINPAWFCEKNQALFSVVDNAKKILGSNDERIGKFKLPSNKSDPWHGYPVEAKEDWNTPSDRLLDLWEEYDIINGTTRRRIERSKI